MYPHTNSNEFDSLFLYEVKGKVKVHQTLGLYLGVLRVALDLLLGQVLQEFDQQGTIS